MLFSIIVPFKNAERTLPATLDSLQSQSLADWEALLIDDGSRDRSVKIAETYAAADGRIKVYTDASQQVSRGAGPSRNIGIAAARGTYIAFCDADDVWMPEKLEAQCAAFEAGADIVFSSYTRVDSAGRHLGTVYASPCVTWENALYGNPIGCLTGAYRRSRFADARMQSRDLHEDYAFWLDLLSKGGTARGLAAPLAQYRVGGESLSANKRRAALEVWKILREQEVGLPKRIGCFLVYARRALLRRL